MKLLSIQIRRKSKYKFFKLNMVDSMNKTLLLIFFLVFSYSSYAATGLNIWAWGSNSYGAYGNGTYTSKISPEQIGIDTNWAIINAGYNHTLAIKNDGTLWAWGYNSNGALGDGTNTNKNSPEQIGTSSDWAAISGCERRTNCIKNRWNSLGLG